MRTAIISITPEPSEAQAEAIALAVEAAWPKPQEFSLADSSPNWRFSKRSWATAEVTSQRPWSR